VSMGCIKVFCCKCIEDDQKNEVGKEKGRVLR
jgi:hypothetical protein